MSHELRTPLTSVIGYSQVLLDERIGPLNPDQQKYVNNIIASGKHQLNLINNVLDMTKIETGKFSIEEVAFSPRKCLDDAVAAMLSEAKRKVAQALQLPAGCCRGWFQGNRDVGKGRI